MTFWLIFRSDSSLKIYFIKVYVLYLIFDIYINEKFKCKICFFATKQRNLDDCCKTLGLEINILDISRIIKEGIIVSLIHDSTLSGYKSLCRRLFAIKAKSFNRGIGWVNRNCCAQCCNLSHLCG